MGAALPGVIIAGGRATRMGGGDKGLLLAGGQSLIGHVITRLRPQCGQLALNANGDAGRFADLGLPVLPDSIDGLPGPLAGVLAALDWAAGLGADAVLTAAADTPLLPPDLVRRLAQAADASGCAIAASPDADGIPRRHPVIGLWRVDARGDLRAALAAGLRRQGEWAARQGAEVVIWPSQPIDPFFNVNTPADLARADALLDR